MNIIIQNLNKMMKSSTTQDAKNALKIYGADEGVLKGKMI